MTDKFFVARRETLHQFGNRPFERRNHHRLLCSDLIQISWTEPKGTHHQEIVVLENLSHSGFGLFTGVPLARGTTVRLVARDLEFQARVSQCVFKGNGYLVGVALDPASKTSQDREFLPEHLLDVSLLEFE